MRKYLDFNISTVFLVLLFFPFWTIIPGPKVQPLAVFPAIMLLLAGKKIKLLPLTILTFSGLFILTYFLFSAQYKLMFRIESASVLIIPLLIYTAFSEIKVSLGAKLLKRITISFAIIAFIQSIESLDFIFDILRPIIPIGKSSSITAYRGVSLLSPEPSNAAFVIATILWFWKLSNERISLLYWVLLTFLVVTNRSGTMFLLIIPFVISNMRLGRIILILSLSLGLYPLIFSADIRALEVTSNIAYILRQGLWKNTEYWYLISGPRFVEVYIGYLEAFRNPFGLGLGCIEANYTQIIQESGVSMGEYWDNMIAQGFFTNSRPNSYLSYLSVSLGLLPAYILLSYLIIKVLKLNKYSRLHAFWAIALIMFRGTVVMPYPWIVLGTLIMKNDIYSVYKRNSPTRS